MPASLANRICLILGIGFLLVGIIGFAQPSILGMHLTMAHSIVHLATGAIALWLGLKGTTGGARTFCIVFGAVYVLLGLAGFVLGQSADPSSDVPGPADARMFKVIPGILELGTMDHIVHVLLGSIFLIGGFMTRPAAVRP